MLGLFANVPAVVRINDLCTHSCVSSSFLHNHNVPCSVTVRDGVVIESTSGPVHVLTVDGWYDSRQSFCLAYLRGCDVELGCDWLNPSMPSLLALEFNALCQGMLSDF